MQADSLLYSIFFLSSFIFCFVCFFFNTGLDPQNWYQGLLTGHNLQFENKWSRACENFKLHLRAKLSKGQIPEIVKNLVICLCNQYLAHALCN